MMMRTNFEIMAYKPMNINEMEAVPAPERRVPARRRGNGPGIGTVLLGLVCVAGMFGVLGVLYAFG